MTTFTIPEWSQRVANEPEDAEGPYSFGEIRSENVANSSSMRRITGTGRSRGSGELAMQHSIGQQLKLNQRQMSQAVSCNLSRGAHIDSLRVASLL